MSHDLPVERIMQTGLLTCEPDTPLRDAAARMAERRCSSIVVMQAGESVGIWTEHDALNIDFADAARAAAPDGGMHEHSRHLCRCTHAGR